MAPPNLKAALEANVRAYSDAYLGGDAERAWELLSTRCKQRINLAQMRALVEGAESLYGEARMQSLRITEFSGSLARVTYRYTDSDIDQLNEPWILEGDEWHQDDC